MPLVPFSVMMQNALEGGYAVGYFQAWNLDSLEAILQAGEESNAPVLLGFGGTPLNQKWFDQGGLEYLSAMGRVAVKRSKVPVCFILNEVKTLNQCLKGIELGFNVVMLDSSSLSLKDNIHLNKELVEKAHLRDVAVEGELGQLPVADEDFPSSLTNPEESEIFVRETGVDALAVSIGNIHLLTEGEATINLDLLKSIQKKTGIPLVLHGGTGFPRKFINDAIRLGVSLFHVGSSLKLEYFRGIKSYINKNPKSNNIQLMVGSREKEDFTFEAKQRIKKKVKEYIKLFGSKGKASWF